MTYEIEPIRSRTAAKRTNPAEDMVDLLQAGLVSEKDQSAMANALSPSVQRELVQKISSLDASVLTTFKRQLTLIDTVLRSLVSEDGTPKPASEDSDISLKDAMTLSLRVTQIMVRDLPKLYTIERIQKQEEALRRVMEKHLSKAQQEELLEELESIEAASS